MNWLRIFRREQADLDVQQEIETFLAEETAENLARGMSPEESRRLARIKFGNPQQIRENLWRQNSLTALDICREDAAPNTWFCVDCRSGHDIWHRCKYRRIHHRTFSAAQPAALSKPRTLGSAL